MSRDIAVVVMTCDNFMWVWEGWAHWFKKYWCFDLPWPIYFATETLPCPVDFATGVQTGKGAWTERAHFAIDKAGADTIFFMLEDYWLRYPMSGSLFMHLANTFHDYDMDCLRVCYESEGIKKEPTQVGLSFVTNFVERIMPDSPYLFSTQASFWKKSVLLDRLVPGVDIWKQEVEGTKAMKPTDRIYKYNLDWYANAVNHGKWDKRDPFVREYLDALVQ